MYTSLILLDTVYQLCSDTGRLHWGIQTRSSDILPQAHSQAHIWKMVARAHNDAPPLSSKTSSLLATGLANSRDRSCALPCTATLTGAPLNRSGISAASTG